MKEIIQLIEQYYMNKPINKKLRHCSLLKNYVIVNHTCLLRCCSEIKKLRHCSSFNITSLLCPVTHGVRYIVGSTNRGVEDTKNYRHISTRRPRGVTKTRALRGNVSNSTL